MPEAPAEPTQLRIKKYPNRRFYDTTQSRHVTLENIFRAIRAGHRVEVTDSRTGDDITARVLAQIILELDTLKLDSFPTNLLHQIIRANDTLAQEFLDTHFADVADWFDRSKRYVEGQFRQALGLGTDPPNPPNADDAPSPEDEPPAPTSSPDLGRGLDQLSKRLEGLQDRLRPPSAD